MPIHSSTVSWETPWTEKPGGLNSMELHESWTQLSNRTTSLGLGSNSLDFFKFPNFSSPHDNLLRTIVLGFSSIQSQNHVQLFVTP